MNVVHLFISLGIFPDCTKIAKSFPHFNMAGILADVSVMIFFLYHVCIENREECCLQICLLNRLFDRLITETI